MQKRLHSFRYALNGIRIAWQEELNFRLQIICALVALLFAWIFGISKEEWVTIIFLIGFVLTAESFNTALEELCDKFQPTHDPHIAKIKDLAAAAVLIASISSLIAGAVIFIPRILDLL